ncbi:MAG: hypothetical protein JXA13_11365 [Anaerolineales bacterium]|nr:hypothetical protein [Anaerolineales bacterium]
MTQVTVTVEAAVTFSSLFTVQLFKSLKLKTEQSALKDPGNITGLIKTGINTTLSTGSGSIFFRMFF